MSPHADANWWDFTIESNERNKTDAIIQGERKVNPVTPDERYLLDYHQYIGLGKLLDCQVPSSRIPDERIFIITHQLFELVFKQMIFDFAVIAKTFEILLSKDEESFKNSCQQKTMDLGNDEDFWRPALHASGRLAYSSKEVLPALLKYLDRTSKNERDGSRVELFHSDEFKKFRENLIPASGFQTAQFRLIGRALGKSNLFAVNLFPSLKFQNCYVGKGTGDGLPLSLADPLVLRNGETIASPPSNSTAATVAHFDDLAHSVLARLAASSAASDEEADDINRIPDDSVSTDELTQLYLDMFTKIQESEGQVDDVSRKLAEDNAKEFKKTWIAALASENERRRSMVKARKGADVCETDSYLTRVLDRIVEVDRHIHGYPNHERNEQNGGFLVRHMFTARRQIGRDDGGTSGGGTLYLGFSIPHLFNNFPALVHYEHRVPIRPTQEASPDGRGPVVEP